MLVFDSVVNIKRLALRLFFENLYLEITILKNYGIAFMSRNVCTDVDCCMHALRAGLLRSLSPCLLVFGFCSSQSFDILVPETKAQPGPLYEWSFGAERTPSLVPFLFCCVTDWKLYVAANWKKHKKKDGMEDINIHQNTMLICVVCLVDGFKLNVLF